MVFSKGLLISLAFTGIIAVLLFFYVRQRTNAVENKINTLIQFVQTETMKIQNSQPQHGGEMRVYEQVPPQQASTIEKIDVSDDSESDSDSGSSVSDSDCDSDSDADSEYSSTSEEENLENTRIISMNNLEQEQLEEAEDVISLNVIKPEDGVVQDEVEEGEKEDEVEEVEGEGEKEVNEENTEVIKEEIEHKLQADLEALTISDLSDGDDADDEDEENEENEENTTTQIVGSDILNTDVELNYKRMKVSELRAIVISKGLTEDAKKLKKPELLQLLHE